MLYTVNSYQENAVFVTTPRVEIPRPLAIKLAVALSDIPLREINRTFEYRSNPVFADIRPRNHLIV